MRKGYFSLITTKGQCGDRDVHMVDASSTSFFTPPGPYMAFISIPRKPLLMLIQTFPPMRCSIKQDWHILQQQPLRFGEIVETSRRPRFCTSPSNPCLSSQLARRISRSQHLLMKHRGYDLRCHTPAVACLMMSPSPCQSLC